MRADLHEALSALADGEVADPERVAEALAEPDAAVLLVTLAEARLRLRDTTNEPSAEFATRVSRAMAGERRPTLFVVGRFTPVIYAGVGLAAGVLMAVLAMPRTVSPPPVIAPSTAARIEMPPVVSPGQVLVAPPMSPTPMTPRRPAPPVAKSVYRFEVGRNWKEGS